MQIQTIQRNIHTTPRKLRLVADMIRKMTPAQAILTLKFTNKAAAVDLSKAIKTVVANAVQQNLDPTTLAFQRLEINEGPTAKRFRAGTRGRIKRYQKRTSEIKIVVSEKEIKEVVA